MPQVVRALDVAKGGVESQAMRAAVLVSYAPQDAAIGNSTVAAEHQGLRIAV